MARTRAELHESLTELGYTLVGLSLLALRRLELPRRVGELPGSLWGCAERVLGATSDALFGQDGDQPEG